MGIVLVKMKMDSSSHRPQMMLAVAGWAGRRAPAKRTFLDTLFSPLQARLRVGLESASGRGLQDKADLRRSLGPIGPGWPWISRSAMITDQLSSVEAQFRRSRFLELGKILPSVVSQCSITGKDELCPSRRG